MTVRELTDADLARLRRSGALVCQCDVPVPEPVWGSFQCKRCWRKIAGT